MTFRLTVLGSSSALPTRNRFPTAHVLNVHERFFLVDCGEGTQMQLKKVSGLVKLAKLNNIFISHLHGDHIFGLFGLLSSLNFQGRTAVLHIYGPAPLKEMIDDHMKYFGENMGYQYQVHIVDTTISTLVYEDHCLTVETIPLKHRLPTCGYLFKEKIPARNIHKHFIHKLNLSIAEIARIKEGNDIVKEGEKYSFQELTYIPYQARSYAFCSDTLYTETIIEQIKNVDLLYHEATYLEDMVMLAQQTMHSTAKQAARIARLAGAKRLLLGHFSSRYDENSLYSFEREASEIFQPVNIVEECESYEIPLVKYELP